MTKSLKAELWLVSIAFIWSATFVIIKNAFDDVPPFLYSAIRFTFATFCGLVLWNKSLRGITRDEIQKGTILGLLFSAGFLLQMWGLNYTTVSKSAFISGSMVVFTPICYWIMERRPVSLFQKLGVIIVIGGLWVFTQPDFSNLNMGDVATLICSALWGMYLTYLDMITRDSKTIGTLSVRLAMVQFIVSIIASLGLYFCFEGTLAQLPTLTLKALTSAPALYAILYTVLLGSIFCMYIQARVQRDTTPVKAALIFSLEPIIASTLAVIILHETFYSDQIWGGALVLGGILAAEVGDAIMRRCGENQILTQSTQR
ncbi:MAG: DMT family transporter [Ignavibacteria bacterium]|nr:DMT family transporter [Ignavibacteria bacterium]